MNILEREFLTFDDVLLRPQFSEVKSRSDIDLTTMVGDLKISIPIISANMDTITGPKMATAMWRFGGLGILHRYADPKEVAGWCLGLSGEGVEPIPSVGAHEKTEVVEAYQEAGVKYICVDVAHGHHEDVIRMVESLANDGFKVIAGNIASALGFHDLVNAGAVAVKVGIGPGSMCTTRVVTGHGIPQLTAIDEVVRARNERPRGEPVVSIIADGGIRHSGDIVKALAVGADAVMIGKLLAGTEETPFKGDLKGNRVYRGMASRDAQNDWKGQVSNYTPEGEAMVLRPQGYAKRIINELVGGIRSGLSYSGVHNLPELRRSAQFIRVTPNCIRENGAHGLGDQS